MPCRFTISSNPAPGPSRRYGIIREYNIIIGYYIEKLSNSAHSCTRHAGESRCLARYCVTVILSGVELKPVDVALLFSRFLYFRHSFMIFHPSHYSRHCCSIAAFDQTHFKPNGRVGVSIDVGVVECGLCSNSWTLQLRTIRKWLYVVHVQRCFTATHFFSIASGSYRLYPFDHYAGFSYLKTLLLCVKRPVFVNLCSYYSNERSGCIADCCVRSEQCIMHYYGENSTRMSISA